MRELKTTMIAINNHVTKFQFAQCLSLTHTKNQKRQNVRLCAANSFNPSFKSNIDVKRFEELFKIALDNPSNVTKDLSNDLKKLFLQTFSIKTNKFINGGRDNRVYRYSEQYAVKLPIGLDKPEEWRNFDVKGNKLSNDLDIYYGEELAELGNTSLMYNADPFERALPIGAKLEESNIKNIEEFYYDIKEFPQKLAQLPQQAYDKLAQNFKKLNTITYKTNNNNLCFEPYNPNNFLIDKDSFKITDSLMVDDDNNELNNITKMLLPFICKLSGYVETKEGQQWLKYIALRAEIFKKCLLASEKEELPLNLYAFDDGYLKKSLVLSGKNSESETVIDDLKKFRKDIPDVNARIPIIAEYFDKLD